MERVKSNSGLFRYGVILVIFLSLSIFDVPLVSGKPFRKAKLPDKGKNFGCATCHVNPKGGGKRNPFGEDYEKIAIKAGEAYTEELGKRDSDGDGFTNDREFEAGTNPGDPRSRPEGGGPSK